MSANDKYIGNDVHVGRNLTIRGSTTIDNTRGSGNDSLITFQNSSETWAAGIDASDSNKFVISRSATLGTNNVITFDGSQNVVIPNNLNVNGQVSLKDPIIELNNDSATTAGSWTGILANRNLTDATTSGVSTPDVSGTSPNVGNTTTTFQLAPLVGIVTQEVDDFYNGWYIKITSGPASGNVRLISDFVNSTALVTVSTPFSATPGADTYELYGSKSIFIGYNETDDSFTMGYSLNGDATAATQTISRTAFKVNNSLTAIGLEAGKHFTYSGTETLTAIGNYAGYRCTSTGIQSTFIGNNAGRNVTTATSGTYIGADAGYNNTGGSLTAIGYKAGYNNAANNCTFIGTQAGENNTTGINNIAIGNNTLNDNTTGSRNTCIGHNVAATASSLFQVTAVGYQAGLSLTTASNNTLIGANCGDAMTDGSSNTCVGVDAGGSITTGDELTLIGHEAGSTITTGNTTTAVGFQAAKVLSSGTGCTFMGYQAGVAVTTGANNTTIGYQAGKDIVTGSRNTFVGYQAGITTTGSDNTCIGYTAAVTGSKSRTIVIGDSTANGDDEVYIGNNISCSSANGQNIFIGDDVTISSGTLTNAVCIGYKSSVEQNNSIVLGSINGINSATVTHKIGRGTTAPAEALHIHDPDGAVAIKLSSDASGGSNDVKFQWTADDNGTPAHWSAGIDASDTNAWVLSAGTTLGTTNAIKVDTSQNVTMPTGTTTTNILSSTAGMVLKGENTLWNLYDDTANTTVTLSYTAALLNKGIIVRNPSGISTDTLPTGTAMDTGRPSYANDGSNYYIEFIINNISAFVLTMAGNTGFTYNGSTSISANSVAVLLVRRTGTNTWIADRVS